MRTLQQLKERVSQYIGAEYIYNDYGYIAWQMSTGDNIEIIFIEVKEQRKGYGKKLLQEFVTKIKPFHSVFVVRLSENEIAGNFYKKFGFEETRIKNLYKYDDAVISVVTFEKLCQNL